MTTMSAQAMNTADALRLTQAWAYNGRGNPPLTGLNIHPSGDFEVLIRGARLLYRAGEGRLIVSGLVGGDSVQLSTSPAAWKKLQAAAQREAVTMGEGVFELVTTKTMNAEPPVLLLSKSFADGEMQEMQFVVEVRWLLEWATYWRKTRLWELFSGRSEETVSLEGQAHVDWARRHRPRPW